MYLLVNSDLKKMKAGKMAAQVGHAVQDITERMVATDKDKWRKYKREGTKKIVVKATEAQMKQLSAEYTGGRDIWCVEVHDAGHTQIEAGSFTVLGFCPMDHTQVPEVIMEMKLL
jgi:peptidyl-tRNA hydrolase, PTH2 family